MTRNRRRDTGLQPERTLLAWQRTLIVIVVVTLLHLRIPFGGEDVAGDGLLHRLPPALIMLIVAGVLLVHLRRRWRGTGHGLHDDPRGRPIAPVARPWALLLLSAAAAGLGVVVALSAVAG
ncbi:MAG: DUF202 domain-containing protein [Nocardiopsaceae bacterium]|nr:DUF202 domain-containing protein [Nocardiopsaceae bacterium]